MQRDERVVVRQTSTAGDPIPGAPLPPVTPLAAGTPIVNDAEVVESVVVDPYAERRASVWRWREVIWLIVGILEALLAIRLVLRLTSANPDAGFAEFIYAITYPFVLPFAGLFGTPAAGGSAFEISTVVAMVIYLLVGWLIVKVISLFLTDHRQGYTASTRTTQSRLR